MSTGISGGTGWQRIQQTFMLTILSLTILALSVGITYLVADHHAVSREREMAVHQQAGEYYIDPETFERKFRYHWPIAAPTPVPQLEAHIPPFDPQL